jgi:hypothetical protein
MNKASTSILVFGIYVVVVGLSLIFVPNIILSLFTLPAAEEVWIRVLGVVAVALGYYYIQASRDNNENFFKMSIWGRVGFAIGIAILAFVTPGHLPIIVFGIVDLLGAIWTWYARGQEAQMAASAAV